ncbi:MAG: hypothetical protein ACOC8F_03225, partial [Planctomycetota bacterium]
THGRIARLAVAAAATVGLTVVAPHAALLAGGCVGFVLLLSGMLLPRRRPALLIAGGVLAAGSAATGAWVNPELVSLQWVPQTWLGDGAAALTAAAGGGGGELGATASGLVVIARALGRVGLFWAVGGALAALVWLLGLARRGSRGERVRATLWTLATVLVSCAVLAPGGAFLPMVTLAAALTWGLLPAMLARAPRPRSAWFAVGAVFVLLLVTGVASHAGILWWGLRRFGIGELGLHAATGFLAALMLAWLCGARRIRWGLLGVAIALATGAAGELAQGALSARDMELADAVAHAVGALLAVGPYLLAVAARGCELADAGRSDAVQ